MDLMELEEYFRWRGLDVSGAIRVDGHYRGCALCCMQALEAVGNGQLRERMSSTLGHACCFLPPSPPCPPIAGHSHVIAVSNISQHAVASYQLSVRQRCAHNAHLA